MGRDYEDYPVEPDEFDYPVTPYALAPQQQVHPRPYRPPPPRSRAPLYTALAVAAVVLGLALTITLTLATTTRREPPPTASPRQMILDESDFDTYKFFVSDDGSGADGGAPDTRPKACDFLTSFKRPSSVKYATATWSERMAAGAFASVYVEAWADDHLADQVEVVEGECRSFSFTDIVDDSNTVDVEAEIFAVEGADADTVGTQLSTHSTDGSDTTSRWYETIVRETTVRVGMGFEGRWTDDDEQMAVDLLNKQIERVRSAR